MNSPIEDIVRVGFGQRIADSFKGVLLGILLVIGSFCLLWWNEGDILAEHEALKEMSTEVVSIDSAHPVATDNGKTVHAIGALYSKEYLKDPQFLNNMPYLKIRRKAEMYQWVETKNTTTEKRSDGSRIEHTTYSYNQDWKSEAINSNQFKEKAGHENPPMLASSQEFSVSQVTFGAYDGHSVLSRVPASTQIAIAEANVQQDVHVGTYAAKICDGKIYFAPTCEPSLGAVRLSYLGLKSAYYSVVASQVSENALGEVVAHNGKTKFLIALGSVAADEIVHTEVEKQNLISWVIRGAGFLLMWLGLWSMLSPISTFLDVIPILGSLVEISIAVFTLVIAAFLTAITIALSWIGHRPIALIAVVGLIAVGFSLVVHTRNKSRSSLPEQQSRAA